jgi:PAS domain S-box-containing protein
MNPAVPEHSESNAAVATGVANGSARMPLRGGNGIGNEGIANGKPQQSHKSESRLPAAPVWENLLDNVLEEGFNRLSRLAVNVLHVPVAMVNLAGTQRHFLQTSMGRDHRWEDRLGNQVFHSFCEKVLASGQPLLIPDIHEHPLGQEHLELTEFGVIAYMGIPLRTHEGRLVGAMCVIDSQPRAWTSGDIRILNDLAGSLITEIAERVHARSLRKTEERLRLVVDAIEDYAIYTLDPDGRVTTWNCGAEKISGYAEDEALGEHYDMLFVPEDRRLGLPEHELDVARRKRRFAGEGWRRRKDGSRFWASVVLTAIRDENGHVSGYIQITRDITERMEREREIAAAREAAEAASRAKDQFLAVVSHELRTPLTPVLASAMAMQDDPGLPESLRPTMQMISRNVELEARLIDDLLDLTRLRGGRLQLRRIPVDAHKVLRDALAMCDSDVMAKRLTVNLDLVAASPYVAADAPRLQQIFWNLLRNAIKFTPDRGRLSIQTRNESGALLIELADTGIGIDPRTIDRLFEAFEQGEAEDGIARRYGGLGLGLAIARALVEAHGGKLTAHSEGRDHGTCFTIALPIVREPPASSAASSTDGQAERSPRPLRILLVEDHLDTQSVMRRVLRSMGHSVRTAATVREALAEFSRARDAGTPFDLLISDLGLPDASGLDLMRDVRGLDPQVAAIAVSGYGMEDDIHQCRQAGFNHHLTKPTNLQHLSALIQQIAPEKA